MLDKAIVVAAESIVLQPVANRPLAVHALDALALAGVRRAGVAVHPSMRLRLEAELRRSGLSGAEITCVEQDEQGGLASALSELRGFVGGDPFVLHLGDSLGRDPLGPLLRSPLSERDSTVLVQESSPADGVVELASRREGSEGTPDESSAAGVWVLGRGALDTICETPSTGSPELDLSRATQRLAAQGGRVSTSLVGEWWRYRETPGALLEANRFALEGLEPRAVEAQMVNTRIQGAVSIHPTATLESSMVRGPAVIGAGACLREAYVGPYTSIGEDVLIEGAEIEHSIVLAGASISYLGGRLEASVLGPGARVFRDFRLPKAMRLNVGEGAEISLA